MLTSKVWCVLIFCSLWNAVFDKAYFPNFWIFSGKNYQLVGQYKSYTVNKVIYSVFYLFRMPHKFRRQKIQAAVWRNLLLRVRTRGRKNDWRFERDYRSTFNAIKKRDHESNLINYRIFVAQNHNQGPWFKVAFRLRLVIGKRSYDQFQVTVITQNCNWGSVSVTLGYKKAEPDTLAYLSV